MRIISSIIIYIVLWWLIVAIGVFINFAIFDRGDGGITGLAGILGLFFAFKLTKKIVGKIFGAKESKS